jgi:hypothetical protein
MAINSSRVDPTQVKCATVEIPVRCVISRAIRMERSRVEPPAPYVTETKSGAIDLSPSMAAHSRSSPSTSFGGKNSNE